MAEEAKADAAAAAPSGGGKSGMIVDLIFAVINLVVVGGGAFLTYQNTLAYVQPSIREPAAMESLQKEREEIAKQVSGPILYHFDPFTVNLAGTPEKVVRIELSVEMLDQEGFEEVVKSNSHERDMIVALLNRKEFSDLESLQGKLYLKNQISSEINKTLKNGMVKDVYFDKFLVQ